MRKISLAELSHSSKLDQFIFDIHRTKSDKVCPKGHLLKVIGHSCCDDIVKCKCGKWYRCGLGSMWRYYD